MPFDREDLLIRTLIQYRYERRQSNSSSIHCWTYWHLQQSYSVCRCNEVCYPEWCCALGTRYALPLSQRSITYSIGTGKRIELRSSKRSCISRPPALEIVHRDANQKRFAKPMAKIFFRKFSKPLIWVFLTPLIWVFLTLLIWVSVTSLIWFFPRTAKDFRYR